VANVLALVGPTASGKTAAALALAEYCPIEIISVDSALVYRDMDIGTAKPSRQELALVPHHLINIRDPSQAYSAAEFVRDAQELIRDIQSRGKHPLLVGGTMLYLKALRDGIDDLPVAHPDIRAAIEVQALAHGWATLHAELAQVWPRMTLNASHARWRFGASAASHSRNGLPNKQRIVARRAPR